MIGLHCNAIWILILPNGYNDLRWFLHGHKAGLIIPLPYLVGREMGSYSHAWSVLLSRGHAVIISDESEMWELVNAINNGSRIFPWE